MAEDKPEKRSHKQLRHAPPSWEELPKAWRFLVVREHNQLRSFWFVAITCALLYTATIFPYRLCFIHFSIPKHDGDVETDYGFYVIEWMVEIIFIIDLFINFFFTYRDERGREVTNLKMIAINYLKTYFIINLVACFPFETIMKLASEGSENSAKFSKVGRLSRLQRISRILQLFRLVRLVQGGRLVHFMSSENFRVFRSLRGVRIMNFIFGLFWTAHMFACGWFFCASLHSDVSSTWVGMRAVDAQGTLLSERPPIEQWLTATYFILTVFTTVGFGDMNATTPGEICYVMLAMLVGAIVNSIILSEVITIITTADEVARDVMEQKKLVSRFSQHTQLSSRLTNRINDWLEQAKSTHLAFDVAQMKDLVTSSMLPRAITGELACAVFQGRLINNRFVSKCTMLSSVIPPRLPLLIAVASSPRYYDPKEVVYHSQDHAWSVFLVLEGCFADIAKPSALGGISELTPLTVSAVEQLTRVSHKKVTVDETKAKEAENEYLSPYQLHGAGAYFGETEILRSHPVPRKSCLRCESTSGGCLLMLHKLELQVLLEEFPRYAAAWVSEAKRREAKRLALLSLLVVSCDYRELAAQQIQRHFRHLWRRTTKRTWSSRKLGECAEPKRSESTLFSTGSSARSPISGSRSLKQPKGESEPKDLSTSDVQILRAEVADLRDAVRQEAQERKRLLSAQKALMDVVAGLREEMVFSRNTPSEPNLIVSDASAADQPRSIWASRLERDCRLVCNRA